MDRVKSLTILGVIIQDQLSMGSHVAAVVSIGAQSLFALRTLKAYVLSDVALYCICTTVLVSRLMYALPAWLGFASNIGSNLSLGGRPAGVSLIIDLCRSWPI